MVEQVLNVFKENEPMRPGEVADRLGMDKKEIGKIITLLKKSDKIYSPKRCYYTAK